MRYTNKHNLPQVLVDVVIGKNYDLTKSNPHRISVTTLYNNPRPRLLSIRHWNELEEDISDYIWRIAGNAYHYILAKTRQEERLIEEKIEIPFEEFTIVAKPDIYIGKTKAIDDWKITSIWAIKFGDPKDWERQLNLYAWALRKAGFEVRELSINALLRDWRRGESLQYNDYPKIPFKRIKVKLWSFEEQEKYVKERIDLYRKALKLSDNELPICSEKERWKKEATYAVYKTFKGTKNKKASRVLPTLEEAEEWKNNQDEKYSKYMVIEKRESTDNKCVDYCLPNKFCIYWKEYYGKMH